MVCGGPQPANQPTVEYKIGDVMQGLKEADLVITLTKQQLLGMLDGAGTNGVQLDGDPKTFAMIAGLTDQPDPHFTIVTP